MKNYLVLISVSFFVSFELIPRIFQDAAKKCIIFNVSAEILIKSFTLVFESFKIGTSPTVDYLLWDSSSCK